MGKLPPVIKRTSFEGIPRLLEQRRIKFFCIGSGLMRTLFVNVPTAKNGILKVGKHRHVVRSPGRIQRRGHLSEIAL